MDDGDFAESLNGGTLYIHTTGSDYIVLIGGGDGEGGD